MPYHVRIYSRGMPVPAVYLDLTELALESTVVAPYLSGNDLVIDGRLFRVNDISEIKISFGEHPSSSIAEDVVVTQGVVVKDPIGRARQIAERAHDVTAEFITSPPGADESPSRNREDTESVLASRRKVFLVHGRWREATDAMAVFLSSLGLEVVDWDDAVVATGKGSRYPAEILDAGFAMCHVIVVLMTPDDVAAIHPSLSREQSGRTTLRGQARPNVIFEAGMAWQRDRGRTLIIEFGVVSSLSDLSGVDKVRFDGSAASRQKVNSRLRSIGADISDGNGRWLRAGTFPLPLPDIVTDQLEPPTP